MDISHVVAEAILSMRSDAIIAADREGVIHFWNSGAGRLFGYSPRRGHIAFARFHYS